MCRRYGWLHNRVMLYRQDELQQLEKDLMEMDADDAEVDPRALKSRKRDDRREGALRKVLINEIDEKLKQYGECAEFVLERSFLIPVLQMTLSSDQEVWLLCRTLQCETIIACSIGYITMLHYVDLKLNLSNNMKTLLR